MKRESLPRCNHITQTGRHGRSSAISRDIPFCRRHKPGQDPAADLVRNLEQFRSAGDFTVFLSRLISSLSKDQTSTRRAAVLSYVSVSLMHALRSLERERTSNADCSAFDPLPITWHLPSGDREPFINEDGGRAFYAPKDAHRMREIAELGVTSHYTPHYQTASGNAAPEMDTARAPRPGRVCPSLLHPYKLMAPSAHIWTALFLTSLLRYFVSSLPLYLITSILRIQ